MEAEEKYREWYSKKIEKQRKEKKLVEDSCKASKQLATQKLRLAHQAFNDWLLTKNLTCPKRRSSSRLYNSPCPSMNMQMWHGQAEENLPIDFSTRLFLS